MESYFVFYFEKINTAHAHGKVLVKTPFLISNGELSFLLLPPMNQILYGEKNIIWDYQGKA
jgi:hypothetical protein